MSPAGSLRINYNGEQYSAGSQVLTVSNRGFRYGDGLFETMLVTKGRIRLESYHLARLFGGVRLLQFEPLPHFTGEYLRQEILDLCGRNDHSGLARVRLTVFRGEGTVFEAASNAPNFVIESSPLTPEQLAFNHSGLRIGVYPDGCKACDPFASIKSNNFLLYTVAARYARSHQWDDCAVLNTHARVADTCIANLFYTLRGTLYTPPLSEGCVGGVMRRFLLERLAGKGVPTGERPVTVEDLREADEIFLTNAVRGVQWVGSFLGKSYKTATARDLYHMITKEA